MFGVLPKPPPCNLSFLNSTGFILDQDLQKQMALLIYVAYQIIGPTLIIIGILGNVMNLVVLTRPFLNECGRIYLKALAVADLNVLIFQAPMMVRLNQVPSFSLHVARYYAHFELVLTTTFVAFNVYIVLCLTIDRYVSVCLPVLFNSIHTKKKAKTAITVCFVVAFLVSVPLFMLKTPCHIGDDCYWNVEENVSVTKTTYWFVYITVSELIVRVGPAVILAILNILIVRKFRIISKKRKNVLVPSQRLYCPSVTSANIFLRSKRYQDEKRVVILLQAVVVVFFLTMIPSSCLSFIYSESRDEDFNYQVFRAVANLLEIANSALNFCAYFLCSKEFRKGLLGILSDHCSRKPSHCKNNVTIANISNLTAQQYYNLKC